MKLDKNALIWNLRPLSNLLIHVSRDMSRIDLVSKNLLANVFRNCRKRNTVIEKKLCQKITYKYQSFHKAKNILLTFEIFAIFAVFLLYFSDSSSLYIFFVKIAKTIC